MTGTLFKFIAGICASLVLFAQSAWADDISLVLHRMVGGTEIYLSGDAETILSVFDVAEDVVPATNGFIDFDAFAHGTWTIGDTLMEKAAVTVNGAPTDFEAMSFMLHPNSDPMPLRTPLDGMIAIGVCNAVPEEAQLSLSDLRAYVGYFAQVDTTESAVNINLPATATTPLSIQIYDFGPDGHREAYSLYLKPGDSIELAISPMPVATASLFSWGAGLGFLTLSIAFGAGRLSSPT